MGIIELVATGRAPAGADGDLDRLAPAHAGDLLTGVVAQFP